MSNSQYSPEIESLKQERDFYKKLLSLAGIHDPSTFLAQALDFIVDAAKAQQGYLAIHNEGEHDKPSRCWASHGYEEGEVEQIQATISKGIIAASITEGKMLQISSALLDPRFKDRDSVRKHRIEAVLCSPIGASPSIGVLFLQGRSERGKFSKNECTVVEHFVEQLVPLAARLLEQLRSQATNDPTRKYREQLDLSGLIGRSEGLARVFHQVSLVAPLDIHVLLGGPSGSGKTALAHAIKNNSPRRHREMIELNCAALPEPLIESELFGTVKGGHSQATRDKKGKVAAAEGGTLFLDEIGELSYSAQAKLLQLVQSQLYYPLGSEHPAQADVRIIAATNQDLDEAVANKTFREDLLYRLRLLPIDLPPLSERKQDIPFLARHALIRATQKHKMKPNRFSPMALMELEHRDWPGNVRQLAHTVEAAVIRAHSEGASVLEVRHLLPEQYKQTPNRPPTFHEATRSFQRDFLAKVLEEHKWNVTEASRQIDLARSRVYSLIKLFRLQR